MHCAEMSSKLPEKYLDWAGPEVTAQTLAGAISRAQDIRQAILQLHRTVFGIKKELRDADTYVRSLLRNKPSLSMRNGRCGFQQSVLDLYNSVLPACNAALRKGARLLLCPDVEHAQSRLIVRCWTPHPAAESKTAEAVRAGKPAVPGPAPQMAMAHQPLICRYLS
jgi:hypothetical protein